jgi:putative protease
MNIWNHLSLAELENQFSSLTVSPELSRNDLKKLKYFRDLKGLSIGLEILVQGNQELLISEDRWDQNKIKTIHSMEDFIGLKDSKNHIFPLKFDLEGRSIILNSNELCLINYMHYLTELGFVSLVVDARYKSPQYTQKMTEIYLKALQNTLNKSPNLNKKLDQLKDEVKKISTGSITSGSFIRGIKTAD